MEQRLEEIKNLYRWNDDDEKLGEMDPVEAEIDAIRLQMYEETKHMTIAEHIAYFKKRTDPIIKKYHMRISTLQPAEPRKRQRDIWDDD